MAIIIGDHKKEIALSDLIVVPRFLRFDQVSLEYSNDKQSIAEKCESFHCQLPQIKEAFHDSNTTNFECQISINKKNPSVFRNFSAFITHFRHIMSIFDSSRGYSFVFNSLYALRATGNVNVSILEMPLLTRCLSVTIRITQSCSNPQLAQLPIETISNWLNRECHTMDKKQQHLWLYIFCFIEDAKADDQIQQLCEFLKQVSFFYL